MTMSGLQGFPRRHPFWVLSAVALVLLIALFDWNWFRAPLERYISAKTERVFRISDLHVSPGLTPTIRMRDVFFGNPDWSDEEAMARIETLEFSISLRDLPEKVLVPRVALTRPDLVFERLKDDRKNWKLGDPSDTSPSKLRISTLSIDHGRLRYINHGEPFELEVEGSTFDPASQPRVKDADAEPANTRYSTQYAFKGKYHDASFSGTALTGEVLSFQKSGVPFPIKGNLLAGTTKLQVEGTVSDAADISAIDTQLRIEGQTLANLYPFLLLPLPASPPYQLQGHLVLKGNRYTMDDLSGKIGSTDVIGAGAYVDKKPRPLLTVNLRSRLLNMADLGPMIGIQTKGSGGKPALSQAETRSRPVAKAKEQAIDPHHILPAGSFDGSRLQKIDAEATLEATRLIVPEALPLESLRASLRLYDSILELKPVEFDFAGGAIVSQARLDARNPTLRSEVQINLQKVRVDRLIPKQKRVAQGAGFVGAAIHLKGTGNSIADAAAKADGRIVLTIANGRVSNLLDAASSLHGGKVLQLLVGGDREIEVNCGGVAFDVKEGRGTSTLLVVDTEQTQILGAGGFDLARETFDITVVPKPKQPGVLSLRTPVRVFGTFKQPDFTLEKGPLLARAGGAIALAATAPLAALLPLLETGPGMETNCAAVQRQVAPAAKQARTPPKRKTARRSEQAEVRPSGVPLRPQHSPGTAGRSRPPR